MTREELLSVLRRLLAESQALLNEGLPEDQELEVLEVRRELNLLAAAVLAADEKEEIDGSK